MTGRTGLEDLLSGEHAAVNGYATAGAVLVRAQAGVGLLAAARSGYDAHRVSRDRLTDAIAVGGGDPPPALPAYALPFPASDAPAALRLMVTLEDRLCVVAASSVGAASGADRTLAADVLSAATVRAVRLRLLAGLSPARSVVALPGLRARG